MTYEYISVPFQIIATDTSKDCGPYFAINFVEFIWNHVALINLTLQTPSSIPSAICWHY